VMLEEIPEALEIGGGNSCNLFLCKLLEFIVEDSRCDIPFFLFAIVLERSR
jgi:hypothetical protein